MSLAPASGQRVPVRTVVGGGRDTHDGHENSPILVFFSNLLVTHGLVCRALASRHLTLGEHARPLQFPNASVTVITAAPPWRVEVLASDTHLHARD